MRQVTGWDGTNFVCDVAKLLFHEDVLVILATFPLGFQVTFVQITIRHAWELSKDGDGFLQHIIHQTQKDFLTKDLGPEKICGFLERLDDDIFVFTANKSDTISIFHLNSKLSKSASMVGRIVALGVSNDLIAAFDDKLNLCIFDLDGTIRAKTKSTNIEQLI
eukprot:UN22424